MERPTAAAKPRASSASPVEAFEATYEFEFDAFQRRGCSALADGSSVLVAAPTGAGKTVVGEFAAWLARGRGGKTFYTTPIKALSNQKYGDFVRIHGSADVGLLTGDNSVNGDAPIVVMTTEVLRNMIYEGSRTLDGLRYVVLDEVHYLQDRYRGGVWEEVLIHLPVEVLIVSLSATVSNAEQFAEWLQTIRGRTEVIIEDRRPVDIRHWYFAADELLPMFIKRPDGEVGANPLGRDFERRKSHGAERPQRGGKRPHRKRPRPPLRTDVIDRLGVENMLPAIYFIFSRRGCDDAVKQCIRDGLRLTTSDERRIITKQLDERVMDLSPEELYVLGYESFAEGLRRGISSHHAGMIPPFKEAVEALFNQGLVKVVFATETLSLGINMPARTVVIESLMKFTGEKHELITPGQYTQLSGRAGRRGIDELGHCVVLLQRYVGFDAISRLASTRTYPLQSSFLPSYNMAVNLVRNYDQAEAEHLINSSFAQFQADRDVVQLEQTRERLDAYLSSYRERMHCDLGDIEEYARLARELADLEHQEAGERARNRSMYVIGAVNALQPGDVIDIPTGKRRGRYVVLEAVRKRSDRAPRILALSQERSLVRFSVSDFARAPRPVAEMRLPPDLQIRDARSRRALARRLDRLKVDPEAKATKRISAGVEELRAAIEAHPCHECPEAARHLHFADRAVRLEREVSSIDGRIGRRTQTLARRFERVLGVLARFGCVEGWSLSDKGETLARVYNEADLLVVEALETGLLDDLRAPDLAAVLSTLVYEARGPEVEVTADWPTRSSAGSFVELMKLWRAIHKEEARGGLELTREPDPGFASRAHSWASDASLEEVLGPDDAAGDFVRSTKQLMDLLRQLEDIAPQDDLAAELRLAVDA
ncbi:MAG: DEAD/DEAH box helicase, partial [Actinobacteria bacterium]|nr:DEAD/DEAH box helicase [Actinomycetota bacterium]